MILENIKIRNTEECSAPFDGIIMTACEGEHGLDVNLDHKIVFENIDGVVLDGIWDKRPLEFIEVLKKVQENELSVLIDTELSMSEFKVAIGLASYNKTYNLELESSEIEVHDLPMMEVMGSVMIDYYLSHTEYHIASIESGKATLNIIELSEEDALEA